MVQMDRETCAWSRWAALLVVFALLAGSAAAETFDINEELANGACYKLLLVDPEANRKVGYIRTLMLPPDKFIERFISRGLHLWMPTYLPEQLKDAVAENTILEMPDEGEGLSDERIGEPDWVRMEGRFRVEYWKTSPEEFDTFTKAIYFYFSASREQWFHVTISFVLAPKALADNNETIGQFKGRTEIWEVMEGGFPWREVHLVPPDELAKAQKGEVALVPEYRIMSYNIDLEELLLIAEGMREVTADQMLK